MERNDKSALNPIMSQFMNKQRYYLIVNLKDSVSLERFLFQKVFNQCICIIGKNCWKLYDLADIFYTCVLWKVNANDDGRVSLNKIIFFFASYRKEKKTGTLHPSIFISIYFKTDELFLDFSKFYFNIVVTIWMVDQWFKYTGWVTYVIQ